MSTCTGLTYWRFPHPTPTYALSLSAPTPLAGPPAAVSISVPSLGMTQHPATGQHSLPNPRASPLPVSARCSPLPVSAHCSPLHQLQHFTRPLRVRGVGANDSTQSKKLSGPDHRQTNIHKQTIMSPQKYQEQLQGGAINISAVVSAHTGWLCTGTAGRS